MKNQDLKPLTQNQRVTLSCFIENLNDDIKSAKKQRTTKRLHFAETTLATTSGIYTGFRISGYVDEKYNKEIMKCHKQIQKLKEKING